MTRLSLLDILIIICALGAFFTHGDTQEVGGVFCVLLLSFKGVVALISIYRKRKR
jgi:hypothetical protein